MTALTLASGRRMLSGFASGSILPAAIFALVVLMVVPIPAFLLDVGFILNIMVSLAVLMIALNVARPLDFSSFPTVLLFATLFRLALNVASTRVVLVDGHEGPGAAGHVIEAFGNFLIGGDYAVGIFVFIILMIINLVVITKGAGRVSEVSARFILDALPGKQMAIDADLNAGLLSPDEAKLRRQEVATEADFYGSMDGASKFVKGDAVAAVLILVINMLGGLVLGTMSHGLSLGEAASIYLLLAIGDGLVAQIPALLLSIAAASIVTRVSSPLDLSGQIGVQFSSAGAWIPVAIILFILGVLPGMPHFIILVAAAAAGLFAWRLHRQTATPAELPLDAPLASPASIGWDEVSDDAAISLDLGFALVGLVDERKGAPLMTRITGIRRQLSRELGFVVPMVRVRDDMGLAPNAYRISVAGVVVGEDELFADDLLALDSGNLVGSIAGRAVKDPSFGLDAVWIAAHQRTEAVVAGYTVVDAATVAATHLNRIITAQASDLFGMDEAQALIDALKQSAPHLVANLSPQPLPLATLAALCRALLAEGVPLKDFRRIAEAMVEAARIESDPAQMIEIVRQNIAPLIVQAIVPARTALPVITLHPELERLLGEAVRSGIGSAHAIDPGLAQRIVSAVVEAIAMQPADDTPVALVTSPQARRAVARLIAPHLPETRVLSFLEVPEGKSVTIVAVVGDPARESHAEAAT
jgi:flagellar biosynthesis protein FlhA